MVELVRVRLGRRMEREVDRLEDAEADLAD